LLSPRNRVMSRWGTCRDNGTDPIDTEARNNIVVNGSATAQRGRAATKGARTSVRFTLQGIWHWRCPERKNMER
ncbi:MAG: hypothetical protein L0Z50_02800, partial [Verrucomicrobiales bacterium]|nr:hypothetical protein [Verrucomicrobiales bacterium]